jgi:hypothetical protein
MPPDFPITEITSNHGPPGDLRHPIVLDLLNS